MSDVVTAAILAAGSGIRFGGSTPKQLLPLAGKPMLAHSLEAFEAVAAIDGIVVVASEDLIAEVQELTTAISPKTTDVIAGGATRDASTRSALAVAPDPNGKFLVHDAARPLIAPATIAACVAALDRFDAVGVAVPSPDTLLEVVNDRVMGIPDRAHLWRAQTPQGFRVDILRRAHAAAAADPAFTPTDDCGVVARYLTGVAIGVVPGRPSNLKITYPEDVAVAEALLRRRQATTD
jgi:2-C-methyl-D-erythritol 4-phosphate cytidylyltransferase